MATHARVELTQGKSFSARGITFERGKPRISTNAEDIAHFRRCPQLRVVLMNKGKESTTTPPKPKGSPSRLKFKDEELEAEATALDEDDEDSDDDDEGNEAGTVTKYPEWRPNDKKEKLLAAAEARGLALTPQDKVGDIIQLLKEFDEMNADAKQ